MSEHVLTRTGPDPRTAGQSVPRTALDMCAGVIAAPVPAIAEIPRRDTLITTRWRHPEMHAPMPGLPAHAIATYYGRPSPRVWRCEGLTYAGRHDDRRRRRLRWFGRAGPRGRTRCSSCTLVLIHFQQGVP